jgi:hypothetical protein
MALSSMGLKRIVVGIKWSWQFVQVIVLDLVVDEISVRLITIVVVIGVVVVVHGVEWGEKRNVVVVFGVIVVVVVVVVVVGGVVVTVVVVVVVVMGLNGGHIILHGKRYLHTLGKGLERASLGHAGGAEIAER